MINYGIFMYRYIMRLRYEWELESVALTEFFGSRTFFSSNIICWEEWMGA